MGFIGLNLDILDNNATLLKYRPVCPSCGYKLHEKQIQNVVPSTTPRSIDVVTCPKCKTTIDVIIEHFEHKFSKEQESQCESKDSGARIHRNTMTVAEWKDNGVKLFYEQSEPKSFLYNYCIEYLNKHGKMVEYANGYRKNIRMICMGLFELLVENEAEYDNEWTPQLLLPLYNSAKGNGNRQLIAELNLMFHVQTDEDLTVLESVDGNMRLPALPKEFDNNFVVEIVDYRDANMLCDSGYCIEHKRFGMKGYTDLKWMVNPHTKTGIDAVEIDAPAISFHEFLKLFDGYLARS